jgi:hypothetical protein
MILGLQRKEGRRYCLFFTFATWMMIVIMMVMDPKKEIRCPVCPSCCRTVGVRLKVSFEKQIIDFRS